LKDARARSVSYPTGTTRSSVRFFRDELLYFLCDISRIYFLNIAQINSQSPVVRLDVTDNKIVIWKE